MSKLKYLYIAMLLFNGLQLLHPAAGHATIRNLETMMVYYDDTVCVDENGDGVIDDNEPCDDEGHVPDSTSGE